MNRKSLLPASLACLLLLSSGGVSAGSGTLSATIPWEGRGQVFRIGPQTLIFLGSIHGIVYTKTDDGILNEAFVLCPITQRMNVSTQATSGVGQCEIAVDGDHVAYGEFVCEGQMGRCEGQFRLTGGSGRFAGATGSGKMRVRSPIQLLASDLASGGQLRIASGLAELLDVKYRIPE